MNLTEGSRFFSLKTVAIIASAVVVILLLALGISALNSGGKTRAVDTPSPTPEVTVTPEPEFTPEPEPEVTPTADIYEDCLAVWDALGRPITADDEGFPETSPNKFDLDSDGIGCEDNPATTDVDESEIDWQSIWDRTKGNAKEFGRWAARELDDLWDKIAPWLGNTFDRVGNFFD